MDVIAHKVQKQASFFHAGQFNLTFTIFRSRAGILSGRDNVRVPRIIGRLRDEHYVGVFASPAFQVLGLVDCNFMSVNDALVGKETGPGNVLQIVVLCTRKAVCQHKLSRVLIRGYSPRIPKVMVV